MYIVNCTERLEIRIIQVKIPVCLNIGFAECRFTNIYHFPFWHLLSVYKVIMHLYTTKNSVFFLIFRESLLANRLFDPPFCGGPIHRLRTQRQKTWWQRFTGKCLIRLHSYQQLDFPSPNYNQTCLFLQQLGEKLHLQLYITISHEQLVCKRVPPPHSFWLSLQGL